MCSAGGQAADWRDAAAYRQLLEADRSLFAWEWLRRNPGYRAAADLAFKSGNSCEPSEADRTPERWGLHAFERPTLAVPEARPVWCAGVHPYVLGVDACPSHSRGDFDLHRFGPVSSLVTAGDGRDHLLISDGLRAVLVDALTGSIAHGPVELRYRLFGLASAERSVLTLRRLLALWRTGRFCRSLHPREAPAKRWSLMLRVNDALAAGADQHAIAAVLLGREAGEPLWRSRCPSIRLQAQRLVRGSRHMASGGYLELLR